MKKQIAIVSVIGLFIVCSAEIASDNGKAGYTGSPAESKCNNCHDSFALNSGGGSVTLTSNLNNWQYVPGQTYTINMNVARTGNPLFGMGLEALTSTNNNAGTLVITNSNTHILTKTVSGVVRNNVVHAFNGGASPDAKTFTFDWTAPSTNVGNVTMYFCGVAANSDGNESGDYVYSSSQIITPQTTGIVAQNTEVATFSVTPTLAHDYLNVRFFLSVNAKVTFSLYDIHGKLVSALMTSESRKGDCSEQLSLSEKSIKPGIYMLTMKYGSNAYSRKIIVL